MDGLVLYESARRALAEAHRIDEVKDIRDKAVAMEIYAKRARDRDLIEKAVEIRAYAERRGGELLDEMTERGERARSSGETRLELPKKTLADLGVTKTESYQWRKEAAFDDNAFAARVAMLKRQALSRSALNKADIRERRASREAELGAFQVALPDKRFGVIYADPPWRFDGYSDETGLDRGPSRHYPAMPLDDIKALDVAGIAADDCALFLWATAPHLPEALEVMAAWGFRYRTSAVWAKDRIGMGYWFRSRHEHLLVGTRGAPPAPAMGTQWPSVIEAPVREHSRKPDAAYEIIESYFPNLPKIELFARRARPGWSAWGNEAIPADEAAE